MERAIEKPTWIPTLTQIDRSELQVGKIYFVNDSRFPHPIPVQFFGFIDKQTIAAYSSPGEQFFVTSDGSLQAIGEGLPAGMIVGWADVKHVCNIINDGTHKVSYRERAFLDPMQTTWFRPASDFNVHRIPRTVNF